MSAADRAASLVAAGRADEAVQLLGPALAASPDSPDLLRIAALALHRLGEEDQAEALARRLLSVDGGDAELVLATVLAGRPEVDAEALDLLSRALSRSPDDPRVLRWVVAVELGRASVGEGTLQRAQEAVVLEPDSADGHVLVARAQLRLGELRDARLSLERALALDPASVGARHLLQRLDHGDRKVGAALTGALDDVRADPTAGWAAQTLLRTAVGSLGRAQVVLAASTVLAFCLAAPFRRAVAVAALVAVLAGWLVAVRRRRRTAEALSVAVRASRWALGAAVAHGVGLVATCVVVAVPFSGLAVVAALVSVCACLLIGVALARC